MTQSPEAKNLAAREALDYAMKLLREVHADKTNVRSTQLWCDIDNFLNCECPVHGRMRLSLATVEKPDTQHSGALVGWQPKHEYGRYGMGIIRSILLEDHVYLQGKNGDVWRVMLEMDGSPTIECIECDAALPQPPKETQDAK